MYLTIPNAQNFIFPQTFQCIKLALNNALGATITHPNHLTVYAINNNNLLMSLPNLKTIKQLQPNMLVVIYDDATYGTKIHHFRPINIPIELAQFPPTNFTTLTKAAKYRNLTTHTPDDLETVRE